MIFHIQNILISPNLNFDILKVAELVIPVLVAYSVILDAQKRWKKDGYLKHKIELEIQIRNNYLINIETSLIQTISSFEILNDTISEETLNNVNEKF